jgi:hypothetical protein
MRTEVVDGREYQIPDNPIINIDGQDFATGLWLPDKPDAYEKPVLMSVGSSAFRDMQDVRDAVSNPNRTAADKLFPAKDWTRSQGPVSSCNGYAGAGALARARVRNGLDRVFLAGETLYSQINRGRDNGSGLKDGIEALVRTGVAPEGTCKAQTFYTESSLPKEAKDARHRFKAGEWHQANSEFELAVALASAFICVVAVHVGSGWRRFSGDVLVGDNGVGNHAVVCDDVRFKPGSLTPEFRIPNSHGLSWGVDGVGWMLWDRHLSGPNKYHMFYAIRAVTQDPEAKNPPKL